MYVCTSTSVYTGTGQLQGQSRDEISMTTVRFCSPFDFGLALSVDT